MKLRKHAVFVIDSYFKDSTLTALKNERGTICEGLNGVVAFTVIG